MTARKGRVDPKLKKWATDRQCEVIDAVNATGSIRAAAKSLGCNPFAVQNAIRSAEKRAAVHGYAPHHDLSKPVPDPFIVKGVSTYYNAEGKASGQWVKSALDTSALDAIREVALKALTDEIPRAEPTPYQGGCSAALATVYTLTDSHVGMLAWHKEGGADWDLKIAERTLIGCFSQMIKAAPPAAVGFVSQLGDFLHHDGLAAVTPLHGHQLDADGRLQKIIEVAIRLLRSMVTMALDKHERVVLLLAEGNHDMVSSIWLRALFTALYENEPRVEVIDSSLPYYCWQHGATMIGFHHGHLAKNAQLPLLMAAQFPKVWGNTTKRYVHVGHRHHTDEKEHNGITVIQHPTLAARDAYAARGGWIAERSLKAITYHARHGEVGRATVVPEMLEA